jgi:hypothetical protein
MSGSGDGTEIVLQERKSIFFRYSDSLKGRADNKDNQADKHIAATPDREQNFPQ